MLREGNFEYKDHELLHFLDLLIKILLGNGIAQHRQVFLRLQLATWFLLNVSRLLGSSLWQQAGGLKLSVILLTLL